MQNMVKIIDMRHSIAKLIAVLLTRTIAVVMVVMFTFSSCYSGPNPIIIRDIPRAVITEDMSTDAYIYESTRWAIEVKAYIDELINQCIHKVPTIDLRKAEVKD